MEICEQPIEGLEILNLLCQVVPSVMKHASVFVPELPGYGISSPSKDNTRFGIAGALVEALSTIFSSTESAPRTVIAVGHDRGGRITHRLAVSRTKFPSIALLGAAMYDIVPTKAQWDNGTNPDVTVGYFHWPFLANVDFAVKMLTAYGGGQWVRDQHIRIAGTEAGLKAISADGALDVYATLFEKEETIRYSCEDYAYGAGPEYRDQKADQEAGRKIDVPTLVMFSKAKLGARADVATIWKDWIAPGTDYMAIPVEDGHGHYLPEEAADQITRETINFIKKLST